MTLERESGSPSPTKKARLEEVISHIDCSEATEVTVKVEAEENDGYESEKMEDETKEKLIGKKSEDNYDPKRDSSEEIEDIANENVPQDEKPEVISVDTTQLNKVRLQYFSRGGWFFVF